ncbi:DNA transposition protein [Lysobacter oculi]|uniref:DNA transposition protein n=1 Tax=Solilutibacter oculi TaxID=2698682 RepID=A0A344J3R9_9GAMM|nr:ATP-binding protein [Lysobacter oculi]AXA83679.1 DNA transposition protein [Lysobacter oculi]
MQNKVVPISNVQRLAEACETLLNRAPGTPGMALCDGPAGLGKTVAIGWLATRKHAVFVRALSTTTATSLMDAIAFELNIEPGRTLAGKVQAIVAELVRTQRPLFIDEADYIIGRDGHENRLQGAIRDLHDLSDVPVVLVGMAGIHKKIHRFPQLAGRIAHRVEFRPCTAQDAAMLAKQLIDIEVAPDLLEDLRRRASGSVRLVTNGLAKVEQFGRKHGKARMELADWPRGEAFFLGDDARAKAVA